MFSHSEFFNALGLDPAAADKLSKVTEVGKKVCVGAGVLGAAGMANFAASSPGPKSGITLVAALAGGVIGFVLGNAACMVIVAEITDRIRRDQSLSLAAAMNKMSREEKFSLRMNALKLIQLIDGNQSARYSEQMA